MKLKDLLLEKHPGGAFDPKKHLKDPKGYLSKLCVLLDIPFSDRMLSWKRGLRVTDGIWGAHWYDSVANSTGFNSPVRKNDEIPKEYQEIYDRSKIIYDDLSRYKII